MRRRGVAISFESNQCGIETRSKPAMNDASHFESNQCGIETHHKYRGRRHELGFESNQCGIETS